MFRKTLILVALALFLLPAGAFAQFGKNQVIWEKTTWNFYQSAHFDFYFSLEIKDEDVQKHFTNLVAHVEGSYEYLSVTLNHGLKKRPIVVVSRTHSTFEALHLAEGEFMPEGVGAYAFPRGSRLLPDSDMVLVVKPDFLPVLNRTIYTHELVHIFQFDMIGWSFIGRAVGTNPIEGWLYEATADYLANKYAPYSRDDIRKMEQRVAAANVKNPQMGLPTLEMLSQGQANPYSLGAMPFVFLESRYGEQTVTAMITNVFKQRGHKFSELLADVSQGEFSSTEAFDRAHRDYWAAKYAKDSLERPRPYQETSSIKGRQIIKRPYPYPLTSPTVSPDGNFVAFLTYNPKNGIVLAVARTLPRDDPPYIPLAKRKKFWLFGSLVPVQQEPPLRILTTFMPPKHYEYIIAQELNVSPFNGSDLDWWQDANWAHDFKEALANVEKNKKNIQYLKDDIRTLNIERSKTKDKEAKAKIEEKIKADRGEIVVHELESEPLEKKLEEVKKIPNVSRIAFFARKNRDHALFILDANTGKFLQEIEFPLDQAFSPAFSPDGKWIYFSAAENITRIIYAAYVGGTWPYTLKITDGTFDTAPAISPDGIKLVYVAFVGGYQKLFLLDLATGSKTQLTFGRWNDNSPSWSYDGLQLVYTSDEKDQIWNLYTLDLAYRVNRQWTEYYGGVFTPKFVPGENDRVVYSTYLEEDQFRSFIYPNFELFDARLKEPLRTAEVQNNNENMELAFRSQEAVSEQLDQRQLENPQPPPARWKFSGSDVNIGSSTYWGVLASSQFVVQDILANRTHLGLYAQRGGFKYIDYTYLDRSRRWGLAANVNQAQYPLHYFLYSFKGEYPRYPAPDGDDNQFTINNTWVKETSAMLSTEYPFSKWDRVEFGVRPRKRTYFLPLTDADIEYFGDRIPEIDRQFYEFFKDSNGQTNVGFTAAFVHDTVLYSNFGPLHGDALRVQIEHGVGSNSQMAAYQTAQVDVRKYIRLSGSSLFAVRAVGLNSTRPNGDFMLMGGSDMVRNYPYFSVAGNQAGYGSAELRFPVADVALFSAIPFQLRGVFFGDYAVAQFSNPRAQRTEQSSYDGNDMFQTRREWAYGFGLQANIFMPMNFEWAKTKFAPDKWNFNFRVGFNF